MARITDMIATIDKLGGLTTLNRYTVQITPPSTLISGARDIPFLCDTVNSPGIQFATENIKHKGYGLSEKRPISADMDDITATFFVDNSNTIYGFFQKWFQMVTSFDPNHSRNTVHGMSLESFNYPEEYYGSMTLEIKDVADNSVITFNMDQLYPINMGTITWGWENNDSIARLPITFTYRSFSTGETLNTSAAENGAIDTSTSSRDINNVLDSVQRTNSFII